MKKEYWLVVNKDGDYFAEDGSMINRVVRYTGSEVVMLFGTARDAHSIVGYGDRIVKVSITQEEVLTEGFVPEKHDNKA